MTIEGGASMDLTTLFKSCMKTIRTRNKAMGVSLPQTKIFPTSSATSQFYTRAKDVQSNIASHRNLLRDHQKKYLQDHEQAMTDPERNYMEKIVTTNLRIIDDNIKNLMLEIEGDEQGTKDALECRQSILSILRLNFQQVNSYFKELKEKRKKRQKEKDSLFKLHRPAGVKKSRGSSDKPSSLSEENKKASSPDTSNGSQPESCSQSSTESQNSNQENHEEPTTEVNKEKDQVEVSNSIVTSSTESQIHFNSLNEEMDGMIGELSTEERQMLEEENLHLYKELMSNQEEVKQITRQVVELGQMQDFFSEKVDIQAHQIEKIQETIMASTENVKEGNEQVREAMRKDAGFRVWIMFFLIVMSCTILFLDWYNG